MYQAHDVFILPSTYEPWGLVVEEALYWGLPVIVSNRVGAGPDMVRDLHTGEIFDIEDPESLGKAIREISANYTKYRKAILAIRISNQDALPRLRWIAAGIDSLVNLFHSITALAQ